MALEQRLVPRLQQKLVMTPALQLAIKLLQLNRLDLEQTLQQEMVENPLLEEREEREEAQAAAAEEVEAEGEQLIDNLDVDSFFEHYFDAQPSTPNMREEYEGAPLENTLTSGTSLGEHLVWQLEMSEADEQASEICQAVIGNLDEDGYLRTTGDEIAAMGPWTWLHVERAIGHVQTFDPCGVGARDLRECLFLQLELLGAADGLAAIMVRDHLDDMTRHRFKEIARAVGVDLEAVAEAMTVIKGLNPRPGAGFNETASQYITPDVFVRKDGDDYVVSVNDDGLPKLRVSRRYRDLLRGNGVGKETSEYLQEKMRAALWLIRSFGQRQRTIQKVAESIVAHQLAFLDHGVAALRPMVLRDVAEDIEMHESTVSRVVNGKYMHTPQGIFEMKFFFHSGLGHASGADVSSITVKERIRKLVEEEDARKPLSDAALARRLAAGGLQIARRTVAKYREELGIAASKLRRTIA